MSDSIQSPNAAARPWHSKALWLIGAGLLANAAVLLYTHAPLERVSFAQTPGGPMLGARGLYMAPAQLGNNAFGALLMDVDSSTLTVYRFNPDRNRLVLAASRSFRHDRFLEDYNSEGLTPAQVQKLVDEQRTRMGLKAADDTPTVPQTTRPDENKPDGK